MRIRCMLGFHKYRDIKDGPHYIDYSSLFSYEIIKHYDRICTCCGKYDRRATKLKKAWEKKYGQDACDDS